MGQVQCCFELLEHTLCSIWLIQCQLLLLLLEAYHALDDLLGIYICKHCVIGETICPIGGMAVILALVEAAETRDMLHMALTLLACALHQNPQNVRDMQNYREYHLLALFLHRRMPLFDMQLLEIFIQIAAYEASFSEPKKFYRSRKTLPPTTSVNEGSIEDLTLSKFRSWISWKHG
ncbi:protein SPIRRIG-like [Capsicum annuum]|uniref:protein SPIRRIG-like n=1 Tax=Capsicum annuum TaxID=4072 RepID=UPI001FB0D864|nr:protein SPIRRIG-like [Capsicum annuum]